MGILNIFIFIYRKYKYLVFNKIFNKKNKRKLNLNLAI